MFVLTETSTQNIFQQIKHIQPDILVVDSIQTLHTETIDSSAEVYLKLESVQLN